MSYFIRKNSDTWDRTGGHKFDTLKEARRELHSRPLYYDYEICRLEDGEIEVVDFIPRTHEPRKESPWAMWIGLGMILVLILLTVLPVIIFLMRTPLQ